MAQMSQQAISITENSNRFTIIVWDVVQRRHVLTGGAFESDEIMGVLQLT